jgi:hypothetical protein
VFVHGSHKPWFLLYGGIPGNWTFGDVAFTSLPLAWGDAGSVNVPAGWNWQGQTAFLAQANWPTSIEERTVVYRWRARAEEPHPRIPLGIKR